MALARDRIVASVIASVLATTAQPLQPTGATCSTSYRFADLAHKVVGVGSVGTRCWIVLLLGRDASDPLFLQVKEAQASVLEPFAGRAPFAEPRPARGGGAAADAGGERRLPGLARVDAGIDGTSPGLLRPPAPGLEGLGRRRGRWSHGPGPSTRRSAAGRSPAPTPAPATASRSRLPRDRRRFDRAIADFAEAYADQNERDYAALGGGGRGQIAADEST